MRERHILRKGRRRKKKEKGKELRDVWKGRYTDDFESYIVKLQKVLLKEKRKKVGGEREKSLKMGYSSSLSFFLFKVTLRRELKE